jgi:hypothetical protein
MVQRNHTRAFRAGQLNDHPCGLFTGRSICDRVFGGYCSDVLRRVRRRLEEQGYRARAVGLFTVADPAWVGAVVAAMVGAAAGLGGGGRAAGDAVDAIETSVRRSSLAAQYVPHRLLLAVTDEEVRALSSNRRGRLGPDFRRWQAGSFAAEIVRYPFEIDLVIRPEGEERMIFKTNRGPFHHRSMGAAKQVVALGTD